MPTVARVWRALRVVFASATEQETNNGECICTGRKRNQILIRKFPENTAEIRIYKGFNNPIKGLVESPIQGGHEGEG